jgi:hypothetical protein
MSTYKAGDVFEVDYPFWKNEDPDSNEFDGIYRTGDWEVGCFYEKGDYEVGLLDSYLYDTFGKMVLKVEGTHTIPGRAERIFYTKTWIDPDGKEFGKDTLRVTSRGAFTRLLKGRRYMNKAKVR